MSVGGIQGVGALQAAQTRQHIDIAVLGKVQDAAEQQADAALSLLDSVVETVSQSPSDGQRLDVTA